MQLRDSTIYLNNNITKICHHKRDWWEHFDVTPYFGHSKWSTVDHLEFFDQPDLEILSSTKI